jgi:predicted nuclease of restriction endonuclease-like (RecB) superfamily
MDELSNANLLEDLRGLIEGSRARTAAAINSEMTALYWSVGSRINTEVLQGERAEYGKRVLPGISKELMSKYGRGWSVQLLRHCMKFAEVYPDKGIVSALRIQLTWTHIKTLMFIEEPLKRDFYTELAKNERWSTRTLQERINSLLFERTALSKKPEETIAHDLTLLKGEGKMTPDLVFRDPYFLDYLGLNGSYSENDLESAILTELQQFITEMGSDFGFLARQKRMMVDDRDYYLDLLFTHRRLHCLVAVELKLGEFEAAHKGQMELYLRWLEKYEMVEGENPPIGLILCSGKHSEHVELMRLDESNIRVAEYLTKLPDMKLLEEKLRQSIEGARERIS